MDELARWTSSMGVRLLHTTDGTTTSGTSTHDSTHDSSEQTDVTDQGVGAIVFALAIGVVIRAYVTHYVSVPYTVQILVVGILIGLILEFTDQSTLGSDLSISLDTIRFMNPEIIFYALLPVLIFESAFFADVHIFLRELWQVLVLAGPGVVVATIMTAVFCKYLFPYGWDWNTCLYFGAMTSATDPVAVVALMKELGVSERLAVLIEGESLLNGGTSIVVFSVFFDASTGGASTSVSHVAAQFIRLGLGGPVVGFITAMIGSFVVGYILEDHLSEITCTVVVCFSAFLLAEATPLRVSGMLSVVIAGLYMSFYGRPRISPSVQKPLHEFWSLWGYMANTLIFFLTGLVAATKAFGSDSTVQARDWGYLVLLWVACHVVRAVVVFASYPVLKHGYGTDWQQMVVLTYAGLRGAVGLTLGLIVQENEAIDPDVGDKIMFMIAGLAIMTLLINATTCGKLLSYFHMDRATKAQTEIFVRACSAVESKLEHVVEELKKDRFLGDAEWPVVWRYVPIMTSRVYWHRIRYGSIVLANGEDEEISNSKTKSDGTGSGFLAVLRGDRGAMGAGGRFAHLPPRLRATWQSYHRKFHVTDLVKREGGVHRVVDDNLVTDFGNENYHALDDNTVHIMPSTGVVSTTAGNDPQQGKGKRGGIRRIVSQMSAFGKASSSLSRSNSVNDLAAVGSDHLQGGAGGGVRKRRVNMGLDTSGHGLKIRSASSRGGLDIPARGVRGNVALDDGDGVKTKMTKGASFGVMSTLDDKMPIRPDFASTFRPDARRGHSRRSSASVAMPGSVQGLDRRLGHGSMHRGLEAAGQRERDEGMSAGDAKLSKEIEATKRGLGLAKEQLKRVDDKLKEAVRETERHAATAEGSSSGIVNFNQTQDQQDGHGSQAASAATPTLQRASMSSGAGGGEEGGTPVTQQRDAARSRPSISGSPTRFSRSAKEQQEQLAEARLRFMGAVQANYQENFRKGWLSDSGLRVLMENADVQLDDSCSPLEEWKRLRESFAIPPYQLNIASTLRYVPIIGQIVGSWIFKKLAFVFELASNFIAAHEDIDILELLPEGDAANKIARENLKQLDDASGTLGQQLPAFPEVARSLKTQVAVRFLLAKHRDFVHEMFLDGLLNEKEAETTLRVNTEFKIKLDDHPYAEHLPPRAIMLAKVPFLKGLNEEQLVELVEDDHFCQEELHGSNVVLLRQGQREKHSGQSKGTAGWYYIVRGSVQMVTVSQERDSAGGIANTASGGREGGLMGGDGDVAPESGFKGDGDGESSTKVKEHPLHAGAVFGLMDSMLGLPYRATYTSTSFVHLFFFNRNSFLSESLRNEDLNRSLWRTVGVSVLRKFYGFHDLRLQELQKMVQNSEFVDVMQEGVGEVTTPNDYKVEALRAKAASRAGQTNSNSSLSELKGASDGTPPEIFPWGTHGSDHDDGRIHIHQLKDNEREGIAKTLSDMGLYNMDKMTDESLAQAASMLDPSSDQTLKVVDVEPNRLVLLAKGQLMPRPPTNSHPAVDMHTAPCLLTDVSGRLVFSKDTKMFLIPISVIEKSKKHTSARRTRLEKATHRQDTIQDLNELRLPGARHVGRVEMDQIKQDALGIGARTDLKARQVLSRKHSEMAKRASEAALEDNGAASTSTPDLGDGWRGAADGGSAAAEGVDSGVAPRKSFVMRRSWGGIKMVEVDEHGNPVEQAPLGSIMEERERAASTVSSSKADQDGAESSPSRHRGGDTWPRMSFANPHASRRGGLAALRERLVSASNIFSERVGRSASREEDERVREDRERSTSAVSGSARADLEVAESSPNGNDDSTWPRIGFANAHRRGIRSSSFSGMGLAVSRERPGSASSPINERVGPSSRYPAWEGEEKGGQDVGERQPPDGDH